MLLANRMGQGAGSPETGDRRSETEDRRTEIGNRNPEIACPSLEVQPGRQEDREKGSCP